MKVFILYCKDSSLHESYGISEEEFCQAVVELADILVSSGGIECFVDFYEKNEQLNWNRWTEKKISESAYVLMVCSPQLIRHLKSEGRSDIRMYKGMFFSDTVVNTITAPKFVPVFLNNCEPRDLKYWLPPQLHTSRQFQLRNLSELHQSINPDIYNEAERRLRLIHGLKDSQHQELASLLRYLRGECEVVPPESPQQLVPLPFQQSFSDQQARGEELLLIVEIKI